MLNNILTYVAGSISTQVAAIPANGLLMVIPRSVSVPKLKVLANKPPKKSKAGSNIFGISKLAKKAIEIIVIARGIVNSIAIRVKAILKKTTPDSPRIFANRNVRNTSIIVTRYTAPTRPKAT